eukprot:SAG31_NODE_9295_length_1303_cov_1.210133_1_plen_94_part_00
MYGCTRIVRLYSYRTAVQPYSYRAVGMLCGSAYEYLGIMALSRSSGEGSEGRPNFERVWQYEYARRAAACRGRYRYMFFKNVPAYSCGLATVQ